MSLPIFEIRVIKNDLFNKRCTIAELSDKGEVKFYGNITAFFLKCFGIVQDVKDKKGKIYHLNRKMLLSVATAQGSKLNVSQSVSKVKNAHRSFDDLMKSNESADTLFTFADTKTIVFTSEQKFELMKKAAELDHTEAQRELGKKYFEGSGTAKDPVEGIKWLEKAALKKDHGACQNLGNLYWRGEGIPQDKDRARKWLVLAINIKPVRLLDNKGTNHIGITNISQLDDLP